MSGSTSVLDSLVTAPPTAGMLAAGSYPVVQPHPAPDNPNVTTNLSDADYAKFKAGTAAPPASAAPKGTTLLDSLPPVDPTPGMLAAQGKDSSQSTWRGIGQNFAAGANQAIAGAWGSLADIPAAVINDLTSGPAGRRLIPPIQNPVGGSTWLQQQWGNLTGVNPAQVPAQGEPERIARAAGGAVAQVPLMALGGAALEPAAGALGGIGAAIREASGTTPASAALTSAAAGIGGGSGQAAEDAAPGPLKPYANLAGNIAGAGAVAGPALLGSKYIARPIADVAGRMGIGAKTDIGGVRATQPQIAAASGQVTNAIGQEGANTIARSVAAEDEARHLEAQIADDSTSTADKAAAQTRLSEIQPRRVNLVPNSEPTTAQLTGAGGVLEKAHRVAAPEPFLAREAEQNNARLAHVNAVQPEGDVTTVGRHFTDLLNQIEADEEAERTAARGNVQTATEGLGGAVTPAVTGAAVRRAVAPSYEHAVGGARQGVEAAIEGLGTPRELEDSGAAVRESLATKNAGARTRERMLWEAIDPEGKLALPVGGARQAAASLLKEISPALGDVVDAREGAILNGAAGLPDIVAFRDAQRLRSNIGVAERALRAAPGNDQSLRRLGILKDALDGDIEAGADAAAVSDPGVAERLAQMVREDESGPVAGGRSGQGNVGSAGQQASSVPGEGGTGSATTQRPRVAARVGAVEAESATAHLPEDLSEDERELYGALTPKPASRASKLEPNFTPEARNAYATARAATLARKTTYGQGPVGEVLRPGKQGADYAVHNADVTRKFLNGRPTEPDNVRKYIDAVGGESQAVNALRDGLIADLRRSPGIFLSDGAVNPDKFAQWIGKRGKTIDLFPGLRDQLGTVSKAQEVLDRAVAEQGVTGDVMERGPAGFVVPDADVTTRFLNRQPTEPANVAAYIKAVGGEPAAVEAMQDGLVSELRSKGIINTDGTVNNTPFIRWQRQRAETIKQFPGLADKFSSAVEAQKTLDQVTAAGLERVRNFQNGVARDFLKEDPAVAVRRAFTGSSDRKFSQLVDLVRGNTDAEEGLKRGVVDYLIEKTRGAQPTGDTEDMMKAKVFRDFVRENNASLKRLFGGQGIQNLDMVAADLRRAAQRTVATGNSDTAANIAAGKRFHLGGKEGTHLTAMAVLGDMVGRIAEHAVGGEGMLGDVAGVGAALGGYLLHSLRQAGIATQNDLVREAMLHPKVALELMAKASEAEGISRMAQRRIANALQGAINADMSASVQKENKQ